MRGVCEQARQQLRKEPDLDHLEERLWIDLHRHALMSMMAQVFLRSRRPTAVAGKKELPVHLHNPVCQRYDRPFLITSCAPHQTMPAL
ncbi:hypothetical protein NJLHNGOC_09625 [Novacetimonas cocois]|uniref:Uncharacterized protein n=1 Tax=Novacetimonas cocois TaxID=1747507 RepID=A0A365YUI8_9PROT|nr:hypothetical protein NJLHNGOC_09625 [Novacetimonas cocois]